MGSQLHSYLLGQVLASGFFFPVPSSMLGYWGEVGGDLCHCPRLAELSLKTCPMPGHPTSPAEGPPTAGDHSPPHWRGDEHLFGGSPLPRGHVTVGEGLSKGPLSHLGATLSIRRRSSALQILSLHLR